MNSNFLSEKSVNILLFLDPGLSINQGVLILLTEGSFLVSPKILILKVIRVFNPKTFVGLIFLLIKFAHTYRFFSESRNLSFVKWGSFLLATWKIKLKSLWRQKNEVENIVRSLSPSHISVIVVLQISSIFCTIIRLRLDSLSIWNRYQKFLVCICNSHKSFIRLTLFFPFLQN